jgi:hypothetical protein
MGTVTLERAGMRATAALARAAVWPRIRVARVTWHVFLVSRLIIWLSGGLAVFGLGTAPWTSVADPTRLGLAGSRLGDLVLAPAVRWDAIWYLDIARHGYGRAQDVSFSPLFPLLVRAVSEVTGGLRSAGVLVGLVACLAALETVRRLAAHELGEPAARRTVALLAFGPMGVFLSAVYTDGLFLALSAGAFLSARRGRWARAGLLGALAAVSRPAGVLLVVPLLTLFLYGPRDDRRPRPTGTWWRPRFAASRELAWLAPVILLPAAFAGYLAAHGYGAAGTMSAQRQFMHHAITMPWTGAVEGLQAGAATLAGVLHGSAAAASTQAVVQAAALLVVGIIIVGTSRRLPLAYGIATVLPLLVHLSSPSHGDPLKGFARYASLRFGLFIGAAAWSLERRIPARAIVGSAVLMAMFAAQFATWHMVGSLIL